MKKIALIAAVAATVAAPAFAQSASTIAAIQHFNLSAERTSDLIPVPNASGNVVNAGSSAALERAFEILNSSADTASDLRGLNGATVFSGTPAAGAEIFERLRAASLEDE